MKGASSNPLMDLGREWIGFRIISTLKQVHVLYRIYIGYVQNFRRKQ
jgi:hypothetical protein